MRARSEFMDKSTDDIVKHFLSTCRNQRTREEYYSYINLICDFCMKDFLSIDSKDATSFFNYMTARYNQGTMAHKTICVRLSCYNSFAKFINSAYEDLEYRNPFIYITRPEVDDKINPRRIPSLTELDSVMSQAKSVSPMYYVILTLATRIGLSATNIVNITTNHIIEENGAVFLYIPSSDGMKNDMYVKLPDDVQRVLLDYISSLSMLDEAGHIFYNKRKNPLTIKNLDDAIRQIMKDSDVLGKYTLKDLRSRAILDMVESGAAPSDIAAYTGLSNMRVSHFCNASGIVGQCPADLVNFRVI